MDPILARTVRLQLAYAQVIGEVDSRERAKMTPEQRRQERDLAEWVLQANAPSKYPPTEIR